MTLDPPSADPLALAARERLPDALRALVEALPREGWEAHPRFSELIRFWLARHQLFRRLMGEMRAQGEAMLDRAGEEQGAARGLSRLGGLLVGELHGHHQIEDLHYFPALRTLDPRARRGFDILDADHHALDAALDRLGARVEGVARLGGRGERAGRLGGRGGPSRPAAGPAALGPWPDGARGGARAAAGALMREIDAFVPLLDRHLVDEEELVVPVLLRHAPAAFR